MFSAVDLAQATGKEMERPTMSDGAFANELHPSANGKVGYTAAAGAAGTAGAPPPAVAVDAGAIALAGVLAAARSADAADAVAVSLVAAAADAGAVPVVIAPLVAAAAGVIAVAVAASGGAMDRSLSSFVQVDIGNLEPWMCSNSVNRFSF